MKLRLVGPLFVFLSLLSLGQATPQQGHALPATPPLDRRVHRFELKDAIFRDGVAELTSIPSAELHIGFEEILRDKIQHDPNTENPHFSLHLENQTVRTILDTLCSSDARYTWSTDGLSINLYPRATVETSSYFFNRKLEHISLTDVPDPAQALTPLSKQIPDEQVGYSQAGGDLAYSEPWTVALEHLTVRQFVNRIVEHMGHRSSWIWQGGLDERMFTFVKTWAFNAAQETNSR
jgi:hypothetical protein